MDVANCYHDLAGVSFRSRDPEAARRYFDDCLKLRHEVLKKEPDNVLAKLYLAIEHERVGDFQLRSGDAEEAKDSLLDAVARYEQLVKADPANEDNKRHLARACYLLGTAYLRLQKQELAAQNHDRALEMRRALAEIDSANLQKHKDYMVNLARCGQRQAAAKMAEEIHKKSPKDVGTLVDLMRCYALCNLAVGGPDDKTTPTAEQAKLREAYAASAANCLEQAIANGCKDVVEVETDPDIDAIRKYPAFQHALEKLRQSVQPVVTGTTPSALAPK